MHVALVLTLTLGFQTPPAALSETWEVLARHLTDQQLLELPMLAGQYHKVAYVQNSLRVRLRECNPGLSAR